MRAFRHHQLQVCVFDTSRELAEYAAAYVSRQFEDLLRSNDEINVAFSGAESQQEFHRTLAKRASIPWNRVNTFTVDEFYAPGMNAALSVASQPTRDLFSRVRPRSVHLINFAADDPRAECARFEQLLTVHPLHLACLGVGASGHVAFNEPGETDFHDGHKVRLISVAEESKRQLRNDPNFSALERIPDRAITITVAELLRCPRIIVIVPYRSKAAIVRRLLESEVTPSLPASALMLHPDAVLCLDADSFSDAASIER